jgi:hypothetical protein
MFIIGIILALVIAGCVSPPGVQPPSPPNPFEKNKTCRNVTEEVSVVKEECGNVSFTEQVCGVRKLNYTATLLPKVDLCIGDGVCVGNPLGDCQECSKAMTRCVLVVYNEEPQEFGVWTVGANYTLGNFGFNKDPITQTIGPGQSYAFDFNQIYNPGQPINSASCALAVTSEPSTEECYEVTRLRPECNNVTRTVATEREVCG